MRTKKEIKKRITEIQKDRDDWNLSPATRTKYNSRIGELEWVLNE